MALNRQQTTGRGSNPIQSTQQLLFVVLGLAFLVRLIVALRVGVLVEESRMAFAIETIASRGIPKLQSDVMYLLGTPIGYLFAPLAWVFDGADLISAIRIGHVFLSTIGVFIIWRLTWELTGRLAVTVAVSLAAALDPFGVFWGTMAFQYSMLSLATLLVVYSVFRAVTERDAMVLRRPDISNPVVWLVIWLTVGSFTHYAIWLIVPGIVLVSYLRWGRAVFRSTHPMRIALEVSLIPPILVWFFGSWIGPGSGTSFNPGPPEFNQIWDNLVRLRDVDVNLGLWRSLYYGSRYSQIVPMVILLGSGMIVAWYFLRSRIDRGETPADEMPTPIIVLIAASYWGPVLITANGSLSPILIGVLPLGYLLLAIAFVLMAPKWVSRIDRQRIDLAAPTIATALLLLPVFLFLVQGTRWHIDYQSPDPDYYEASAYVDTVLQPDQLLITPFPAIAWMSMSDGGRSRIVPLGGPSGGPRLASETRNLSTTAVPDNYIDYWTGKPAIGSTAQLCQFLLYVVPPPMLLIDRDRLASGTSFRGEFATVINQGTQLISEGSNGLELRTPLTVDQWQLSAQELCGVAPAPAA